MRAGGGGSVGARLLKAKGKETAVFICKRKELTLDEMIVDPIVQALMAADGVDVDQFIEDMERMADVIRERQEETAKE